jgi:hypothetical protein
MNRYRLLGGGIALTAVVTAGLVVIPSRVQGGVVSGPLGQLNASQRQEVTRAVRNQRAVGMWVVTQEFNGSMNDVERFLKNFEQELKSQKLDDALEGDDPQSILILHEDPAGKNNVRMSVGLTVPSRVAARAPLKVEQLRFARAARVQHTGPYEELGKIHSSVLGEIRTNVPGAAAPARAQKTGFPAVLILENDPRSISKQNIKTQLIVPTSDEGDSPRRPRAAVRDLSDRVVRRPTVNLQDILRPQPVRPLAQREVTAIRSAVRNVRPVSYTLVSQTFEGTPAQMGDFLLRFQKEFESQGLGDNLEGRSTKPVAVLMDDPDKNRTIKIEIGFPVKGRVAVRAPLSTRPFSAQRAVSYTHEGRYSQLGAVHSEITSSLGSITAGGAKPEAKFPVALRLLTDPRTVRSAEEIKTQIIVPVGG